MRGLAATSKALVLSLCIATSAICQSTSSQSSGSIAGYVSLGGKAIAGARVTLAQKGMTAQPTGRLPSAMSDAEGHFRLEPVPGGTYVVSAFAPGFVGTSDKNVTVSESEAVEGVRLALQRGGVITGRVTESSGRPLVETTVSLIQLDEVGHPIPRSTPVTEGSMYLTDDRGVY